MSNQDDSGGNLLNQPLSIGELLKGGAQFEINTNFDDNLPDELFDDLHVGGSSDEEDVRDVIISPWDKTFDELRQQMTKLNDDIYKRITQEGIPAAGPVPDRGKVVIQYNAYWEGEPAPFDSSYMRGQSHTFHCGQGEVLEGLELAVKSMLKGEEAQFVISYKLLFHEMGCPPRVKPKADGLFIIKLVNFVDVGDANAIEAIPQEDRNKFSVVLDKVKDVHLKGLDYFKNGKIQGATKSFHKAVTALEFCRLRNEEEQNEQRKFLVKLYTNLAVCYNRLGTPQKACSMCNEIRKISNINDNCKALFQEGRALLTIGEFTRARGKLNQALKLEPNNEEITKEMKLLNKKYEEYRAHEKQVWQRAMGLITEANSGDKGEHLDSFKEEIRTFLKSFSEKESSQQLVLPDGLSVEEINCVDQLVKEFGLKLNVNEVCDHRSYVVGKESKN